MSPTQRSLRYLREQGYLVAITERWNPHVGPHGIRQDLFGFVDLLAVRDTETLAVQVTSTGVAPRVQKIASSDAAPVLRKAGWRIQVHGWRKNSKGKFILRIVEC